MVCVMELETDCYHTSDLKENINSLVQCGWIVKIMIESALPDLIDESRFYKDGAYENTVWRYVVFRYK